MDSKDRETERQSDRNKDRDRQAGTLSVTGKKRKGENKGLRRGFFVVVVVVVYGGVNMWRCNHCIHRSFQNMMITASRHRLG